MYGLGILHVGEETAIALARNATIPELQKANVTITKIGKAFQALSLEDLQKVPDIGPKVAQSIHDWFRESRNVKLLERFEEFGVQIERAHAAPRDSHLVGKSFVITGGLESMSRDEAKEKIRERGGEASESVSKKTDYVVVGSDPGSKYEKAKKLGIKTINEKEFIALMK